MKALALLLVCLRLRPPAVAARRRMKTGGRDARNSRVATSPS